MGKCRKKGGEEQNGRCNCYSPLLFREKKEKEKSPVLAELSISRVANRLRLLVYIYIYICVCVCVRVCSTFFFLSLSLFFCTLLIVLFLP